ncbi:ribosome silencing factor [Notoacmeibacter marinus]|uniref:Ribosomal silencing factor RsfS n=1 Tax=Notoacmeibacter marinus TaxID=1876515 RepID=A0A231V2N3_9HYPH|nr:ribosome silencing factor [Notoacmeibacter marinus]
MAQHAQALAANTSTDRKAEPRRTNDPAHSNAERTLNTVLTSLDDSKAEDILSIDIQGKSSLGDFMVIASGRSHRHVAAIAEHLKQALKDNGLGVARVEGDGSADWILIDQGDIIIHIFRPEVREFYNLEKMWQLPDLEDGTVH